MPGGRVLFAVNLRKKYVKDNPRLAGILLGIGVGVALAVALDNIAIGIGVGFALGAGVAVGMAQKDE